MLKNYLAAAFRNPETKTGFTPRWRSAGLALGITAALLAALVIRSELSWSTSFRDYDTTYVIRFETTMPGLGDRGGHQH